jgi:hypothetical protein
MLGKDGGATFVGAFGKDCDGALSGCLLCLLLCGVGCLEDFVISER